MHLIFVYAVASYNIFGCSERWLVLTRENISFFVFSHFNLQESGMTRVPICLSQISSKPETFHTRQNMVKHAKVLQQPRNKCQVNDTIGMLVSASCLSELHVCCSKVWVQPAKCGRYTNSLSLKSPFAVFCSSLTTRVQRNLCYHMFYCSMVLLPPSECASAWTLAALAWIIEIQPWRNMIQAFIIS